MLAEITPRYDPAPCEIYRRWFLLGGGWKFVENCGKRQACWEWGMPFLVVKWSIKTSISISEHLHTLIACLIDIRFTESVKYHKRARLSIKNTPTLCPTFPPSVEGLASIWEQKVTETRWSYFQEGPSSSKEECIHRLWQFLEFYFQQGPSSSKEECIHRLWRFLEFYGHTTKQLQKASIGLNINPAVSMGQGL